jgi:uncharacterized membrane protein YgdD (TMEM256/DUF423 family)
MAPFVFNTSSTLFRLAAASGAASVLLGAFGAHGLRDRVGARELKNWETAAS